MEKENVCPSCSQAVKWLESKRDNMRICPNCGAMLIGILIIKIIKVPEGPAPEWVRRAWLDLKLLAEPFDGPAADFITGSRAERGLGFIVPKDMALDVLKSASLEAEQWFATNFPQHLEYLTFALNEAEIVEETAMIASLAYLERTVLH